MPAVELDETEFNRRAGPLVGAGDELPQPRQK
jgi:hypothetical protein